MTTTVLAAEELNPLVPHTVEIIVGLIAFLLLFWLLQKFAIPQFEKVYAERRDKIEGGLKRAEEAQEQAAELKRQYEEQLAGLRAEAARIRDDARAEGQQIKAELRAQAEEEAARIRQRGEEQLAAAREQVVRQLRGEIGGLSVQLAERIVGDSLADEDRRRATVDAFLSELDSLGPRETTTAGGAS
ncbi:MAG TPA: F0F1 ATP synthase subunit B [Pseudonocardia sp.]|jgi:F-type H+-transporting ATPase subunit b|uniref:F0F1 ATP synthase subunit B n=1 Tax=Pseudonocardia sp. TaxID=60912 RepID=UPI002B4B8EC8|nr:F0F1 ATP synthase subunit B [Pseudonocardia sp.]HLU56528.1 F0F1 ATP synthase subunit B [Pseudonocardia sp.]